MLRIPLLPPNPLHPLSLTHTLPMFIRAFLAASRCDVPCSWPHSMHFFGLNWCGLKLVHPQIPHGGTAGAAAAGAVFLGGCLRKPTWFGFCIDRCLHFQHGCNQVIGRVWHGGVPHVLHARPSRRNCVRSLMVRTQRSTDRDDRYQFSIFD